MGIDRRRPACSAALRRSDPDLREVPTAPPIARFLPGLDVRERAAGAWHDDFLALGGRLRAIYGSQVALDARAPAYLISGPAGTTANVTCPVDSDHADSVRITSRPSSAETLELPFGEALGRTLQAAISSIVARPLERTDAVTGLRRIPARRGS